MRQAFGVPLLVVLPVALARPALAQVDVSGEWGAVFFEDLTSSHFKREPDGSKWMPASCETGAAGTR